MSRFGLVLLTVGSEKEAQKIAQTLVKEKLAACVNLVPNLKSYFIWKKKLSQEKEVLLLIKTKVSLFKRLEKRILQLHGYQTPEIILLPIEKGFKNYLGWIEKETK